VASLTSYAVWQFYTSFEYVPDDGLGEDVGAAIFRKVLYAPIQFFPGRRKDVSRALADTAKTLKGPLGKVAEGLGAAAYSVGFAFPGGPSVGISWTGAQLAAGAEEVVRAVRAEVGHKGTAAKKQRALKKRPKTKIPPG
jgi:hypothetical protein